MQLAKHGGIHIDGEVLHDTKVQKHDDDSHSASSYNNEAGS
jgi:hypothetical protein